MRRHPLPRRLAGALPPALVLLALQPTTTSADERTATLRARHRAWLDHRLPLAPPDPGRGKGDDPGAVDLLRQTIAFAVDGPALPERLTLDLLAVTREDVVGGVV